MAMAIRRIVAAGAVPSAGNAAAPSDCIWIFEAEPKPVSAIFTARGLYSTIGIPLFRRRQQDHAARLSGRSDADGKFSEIEFFNGHAQRDDRCRMSCGEIHSEFALQPCRKDQGRR